MDSWFILNMFTFRALKLLEIRYDVNVKDEDDKKMLKDARVKCYNNLAAAQLKVE